MSTKRLRANKALETKACAWCSGSLAFGEDVVICEACDLPFHTACWDDKRGCSTADCINAPLDELEAKGGQGVPPDHILCPHCRTAISSDSKVCAFCRKAPTPSGVYDGPRENAAGAVSSLVLGILGLVICPPIFGIMAISRANEAKKLIANDPLLKGDGLAKAGRVLGIIALVVWAIAFAARFLTL